MTKNIICFFLCLCVWGTKAQEPSSSVNWKRDQKIAEQHLEEKDFRRAADHFYSSASAINGNASSSLFYKAGTCYKKVGSFRQAALAFRSVIERDADWENDAVYQLALCQKRLGNYKEAIAGFQLFLQNLQGESLEDQQQHMHQQIAGCMLAIDLQDNKKESDFTLSKISTTTNAYSKQWVGSWIGGEGTAIDGLPDHSQGNFCLSKDKERLFYSKQTTSGNRHILYVRQKKDGKWLAPEKMHSKINLHSATSDYPFIFWDEEVGEVLLFCSDRADGEGGMDVWSSIIKKDEDSFIYSEPKNLGHKINSAKDEIMPFYDADLATLYFSSDGFTNIGGFDVYKAVGRANSWSRPKHLGIPVNSGGDDFYFQLDRMASTRPIEDSPDFVLSQYLVSQQVEVVRLYGQVLDKYGNRMSDVKVILNDYTNDFPIDEQAMDAADGQYSFNISENRTYILRAEKPGLKTIVTEVTSFALNEIVEIRQDIEFDETEMLASVGTPTTPTAAPPSVIPAGIAPDGVLPHASAIPDGVLPDNVANQPKSDLASIIPGPAPDPNAQKAPRPDWLPKNKPTTPVVGAESAVRPDWMPATKPNTTAPDLPESVAHSGGVHPAAPHNNSLPLPEPTVAKAPKTGLPMPVAPDQLGTEVKEIASSTTLQEPIIQTKEEIVPTETAVTNPEQVEKINKNIDKLPTPNEGSEPVAKTPESSTNKVEEEPKLPLANSESLEQGDNKKEAPYKVRTYEEIMKDIEKNKEQWNKKRTANSRDNANYEEYSSW